MEFKFKNGIEIFLMVSPTDNKKIWLTASRYSNYLKSIEILNDELGNELNSLSQLYSLEKT